MKKLILLFPLILFSCNEKEVKISATNNDTTIVSDGNVVENPADSSSKGIIFPSDAELDRKELELNSHVINGDSIIKTVSGGFIPIVFTEEFTANDQVLLLNIKNFKGKKISGTIAAENPEMNIRFNQIKLPNGDFDGPFGREISYNIPQSGEIWLFIGKSLMASGKSKGKFTVTLK